MAQAALADAKNLNELGLLTQTAKELADRLRAEMPEPWYRQYVY